MRSLANFLTTNEELANSAIKKYLLGNLGNLPSSKNVKYERKGEHRYFSNLPYKDLLDFLDEAEEKLDRSVEYKVTDSSSDALVLRERVRGVIIVSSE